ncbi:MAG: flagellin [Candidatus Sumerlaeota bacterium]|nr:flagellin [Candidatus Sumerlaeota bacterium]
MGVRINQNSFSLLVNRNLDRVSQRLEDVYQRLSSGQKINKAGDDPAGLVVSHALRHEIRGMQQTIRNANDALSVTSTAESALGNVTTFLQRLRELTVQAGSPTLTRDNRINLSNEINSIVQEIDRLASTTDFNGRYLLNGATPTARVQLGTHGSEFLAVTLPDARTSVLGLQAIATGENPVDATAIAGNGDLTINSIAVPASVVDGLSSAQGDSSAIAKAKAINSMSDQTGVEARVEPTVFSVSGSSILPVSLDGFSSSLKINGVNIGSVTVSPGDSTGTLRQAINNTAGMTGVTASLNADGELALTAADGRNIEITTTGNVADNLGLALADGDLTGYVQTGRITLTSDSPITLGGALDRIGFGAGQSVIAVDPDSALSYISVDDDQKAEEALRAIDRALAQVVSHRANLGAIQNRLQASVESLSQRVEELSASDQRISDADVAQESARLAQLQILQEAGMSILAQANLLPRTALNLLQR